MVYTPVGVKCPDCARQRGRTVAGPPLVYVWRGAAAGLIAGPIGGIILGAVVRMVPLGGLMLALGLGIVLGELISQAARRNTGLSLQVIAGAAAALAYLTAGYFTGAPIIDVNGWHGIVLVGVSPIHWLISLVGIYLATIRLKD